MTARKNKNPDPRDQAAVAAMLEKHGLTEFAAAMGVQDRPSRRAPKARPVHPFEPHASDTSPAGRAAVATAVERAMTAVNKGLPKSEAMGLCDGLRVPDEAVFINDVPLGTDLFPNDAFEWYALGSSITSSFWVGTLAATEPLMLAAAQAWADCARTTGAWNKGDRNSCLVGLWRVPASDDALVGALGGGDMAAGLFGSLPAPGMAAVAFEGSDNGPAAIWEEAFGSGADDFDGLRPSRLVRVLQATALPEPWKEVRELIRETLPRALKSPQRKPRP